MDDYNVFLLQAMLVIPAPEFLIGQQETALRLERYALQVEQVAKAVYALRKQTPNEK
jgi:hypothetical protein